MDLRFVAGTSRQLALTGVGWEGVWLRPEERTRVAASVVQLCGNVTDS
jgi:hypothetical protein